MAFDWKEYVELARQARSAAESGPRTKAILRSALSRTYYGAFCNARNYARDWLGFKPRHGAEDHGRLRHHHTSKRRQGIANRLDRLRQWRNACDYLDDLEFDPGTALTAALVEADLIFAGLVAPKPK
jgi:hypothetical protein